MKTALDMVVNVNRDVDRRKLSAETLQLAH
jgi:hypothetical protein